MESRVHVLSRIYARAIWRQIKILDKHLYACIALEIELGSCKRKTGGVVKMEKSMKGEVVSASQAFSASDWHSRTT